jgi:uncharacterized protein (TIGR03118 family)
MIARSRPLTLAAGAALTLALALPATAASAHQGAHRSAATPSGGFVQTNLVSDIPGLAQTTDPNLVNAWGVSFRGASPLWVSDNGTGLSTLYTGGIHGGTQSTVPLVVSIPGGDPTGQASNSTSDFVVKAKDGTSGPAFFLFVGETGHITGWNPGVGITTGTTSTTAQDAIVKPHAIYKGLAMGTTPKGPRLYAANFAAGKVEMYNGAWKPVHIAGAFADPGLPSSYSPFNIMISGNRVYVAYAKSDGTVDEVDGRGNGRVDVFTLSGQLLASLHATMNLNAPWGMAIAPTGFGSLAGDLLVGNFGNGRIHAFSADTLTYRGLLSDGSGHPIAIDGLWALLPGNGVEAGTDEVIFTAGPQDESHGLLGTLASGSATN